MNRPDRIRLRHMLEAAEDALTLARGKSRADLDSTRGLVLALVKAVEIVGEAARTVTEPARLQAPGIPWGPIVRMRHRLVHEYFRINLDVLWQTVCNDLPPLVALLKEALLQADE